MNAAASNLPVQLIPMVGREKETRELSGLLADPQNRLITLHGFGGTGKTRLAVEIGRLAAGDFRDGACFISLAPLNSPEHLLTATASALGFAFGSPVDQKQQLLNYLQEKELLLIFDNLEHLLPEAAPFLEQILESAPSVRLLVTSRLPLNTPWEWAYQLRGLEYQEDATRAEGKPPAAVELFLQHLERGGRPVEAEDLSCAVQISRLVNGLPLALLLAASWGRALGCREIFDEIQRGVGFLKARGQGPAERHGSMQAVFDHSWRLLSEAEQAALRKLAVFRGGFDRAAAGAVGGADLAIIARLVDQALLERSGDHRYQIHELLRQYLQDRLAEAGEQGAARDAHLAWFASLAEQAGSELTGERQQAWIERLKAEIDNLSAALEWSLESPEPHRVEQALSLMAATERFWTLHLLTKTGAGYILRLLGCLPQGETQFPRTYARGLNLAGWLCYLLEELEPSRRSTARALEMGLELDDRQLVAAAYHIQSLEAAYRKDYKTAQSCARQALEAYRAIDDEPGIAQALVSLGRSESYSGDLAAAAPHLVAALELARKLGDIRTQYSSLRGLGEVGMFDPQNLQLRKAQAYFEQALEYARRLNDKFYTGHILNSLGEIARLEGRLDEAMRCYAEAIAIEKELGRQDELMLDEENLAFVYSRLGRQEEARQLFFRNLELALKSDHLELEITYCLLGLAGVAVAEGQAALAARALGAIEAAKEPLLFFPSDRSDYDRIVAATKAQLGDPQFARSFTEGQAMGPVQAAGFFLNPPRESPAGLEQLHGLTRREIEILRLVASGLSDQAVAERLVISPRTVNAHLTSIYNKLGVESRMAATQFAREKGLV